MGSNYRHRITDVDRVARRGICAQCGPVPVKPKRRETYWACAVAERQWKHPWTLSHDARAAMFAAQGGLCAICRNGDRKLVTDHDHATGRVRGLLCSPCNSRLGYVEGAWMPAATAYLRG